jgi:hypothetical protein
MKKTERNINRVCNDLSLIRGKLSHGEELLLNRVCQRRKMWDGTVGDDAWNRLVQVWEKGTGKAA